MVTTVCEVSPLCSQVAADALQREAAMGHPQHACHMAEFQAAQKARHWHRGLESSCAHRWMTGRVPSIKDEVNAPLGGHRESKLDAQYRRAGIHSSRKSHTRFSKRIKAKTQPTPHARPQPCMGCDAKSFRFPGKQSFLGTGFPGFVLFLVRT